MAGATTVTRDLISDIQDLDERELAAAFRRWIELSELVAPRDDEEHPDLDRRGRRG